MRKREKRLFQNKKFLDDTFFTQFVLSRASNNTTSPNIGGMDTWAIPLPHILGDCPPMVATQLA